MQSVATSVWQQWSSPGRPENVEGRWWFVRVRHLSEYADMLWTVMGNVFLTGSVDGNNFWKMPWDTVVQVCIRAKFMGKPTLALHSWMT